MKLTKIITEDTMNQYVQSAVVRTKTRIAIAASLSFKQLEQDTLNKLIDETFNMFSAEFDNVVREHNEQSNE
jgi:hypothetical protein